MAYTIHFSSKAEKDIKKLSPTIKDRIVPRILKLSTTSHSLQLKPLTHHNLAQFRLRIGDYRVLYDIYHQDKTILILRIGHRKDIYR